MTIKFDNHELKKLSQQYTSTINPNLIKDKCDRPYFSQTSSFNSSDVEAIYQAKEIIEKNFDNPPTLSDLAQQVRLSNRKMENQI